MNRCYFMINECLAVLMRCDFRPMEKLRIEGQLIYIKKILIRIPQQGRVTISGFCEADFEALVRQLSEAAQNGYRHDATNILGVIGRIEAMLNSSQSVH